jgi:hypothetical protein
MQKRYIFKNGAFRESCTVCDWSQSLESRTFDTSSFSGLVWLYRFLFPMDDYYLPFYLFQQRCPFYCTVAQHCTYFFIIIDLTVEHPFAPPPTLERVH